MLVTKAQLREGEWVLIWGIGGGVATAAFEIARAVGAKTLVTSSSDEKLERAREWGADVAVSHGEAAAAAKEVGGVDVVVETVGEATWKDSLAAVKPGGRVTVCGATSGPNPPAQLHRFWWKQLTVYGSTMGTREDFLGAYELGAQRPSARARRLGLPACGDPRRARADGARRAARQDRAHDPGLSAPHGFQLPRRKRTTSTRISDERQTDQQHALPRTPTARVVQRSGEPE